MVLTLHQYSALSSYPTPVLSFQALTEASGIPSHKRGTEIADYTVPAIRLPDGSHVMESRVIAEALEPLFQEPCAHLDSPILEEVQEAWTVIFHAICPLVVPRMPRDILCEPTTSWFNIERSKMFGMTVDEWGAKHPEEEVRDKARIGFLKLAVIFKADASGPFCLGETPSYADFLIVGFLEWCKIAGNDIYQRIVSIDESFLHVHEACRPWLERNDR